MKRDLSLLQNQQFDLLVCGGGIYGAWTAYDAALRGLKVAIVEQGDWASTTSSASSKLIHGGLRYLESFDFKLVKKALAERQMLLKTAPHRVWPLRFGIPVYADSRMGRIQLKLGLTLYDWLAGSDNQTMHHRRFNREQFVKSFPALNEAALKGGFTYADAQTDDARLVLELIVGAQDAGAVCINYCKMTELLQINGKVYGAKIQDQLTHVNQEAHAKQIVYATGQWLSTVEHGHEWCRLTKGIHLVMPAILNEEALLLTTKSDGRVFFLIPWYGLTLLGTTDTDYKGDLKQVTVSSADISYLLAAANDYLKTAWTETDIIGYFAGLRVLKQSPQASPSAVSRDWELKTSTNGAHYSIGGKLTSARQDAACIVDTVCKELGINSSCATQDRTFPWAPPQENYTAWSSAIQTQAIRLGIDKESAKWLIRRHGNRVPHIFCSIEKQSDLATRIMPSLPFVYADLLYCAQNEMTVYLEDLLRRRLPLLILAKLSESDLQKIAIRVAHIKNWDAATIRLEVERCNEQWLNL